MGIGYLRRRGLGKRSLAGIAGIVAAATLLSKIFGLLRESASAAAFGTGPVVDAYNIAYVLPGFLLILLGGINGPFHSAIVSAVAKREREEIAPIVETVTTLVGIATLVLTVLIIVFAAPIIDLFGPGFQVTEIGLQSREIAIAQLRIMAPITIFACFIGIGFGTLNADDQYWLPSISPLLSSTAVMAGLGILWLVLGSEMSTERYAVVGGMTLAGGTLAGAILQWMIQVPALWKSGLGSLRLRFDVQNQGVRDVLKVLLPATFSSGTMQINVITDLSFATLVPATSAALNFASLLVLAPLGIASNVVLVPFFPIFARLAEPSNWLELKQRIRQALILVALTMLPITAMVVTLANSIVTVVYKRGAFQEDSVALVTAILIAYAVGMFVYLARDIMVRVFYALGDGQTPFKISLVNIGVNAGLDYILFKLMGPAGLVVATIGVNIVSLVAMTFLLNRKLGGLPIAEWTRTISIILMASLISGASCWLTQGGLVSFMGSEGFVVNLVQMAIAGGIGLVTFALLTIVLGIPEAGLLAQRIKTKFGR